MTRLRLPAITARDSQAQLHQITAYLRYLAQALNQLLDELEAEGGAV